MGMAYQAEAPVTYAELADLMGMPTRGHHMIQTLGPILGELVLQDSRDNKPITSALIVNKSTGMPGAGFFGALQAAGRWVVPSSREEDRRAIWTCLLEEHPFIKQQQAAF